MPRKNKHSGSYTDCSLCKKYKGKLGRTVNGFTPEQEKKILKEAKSAPNAVLLPLKLLRRTIKDLEIGYEPRCKDYEKDCPACRGWKFIDELRTYVPKKR